MMSTKENQPPQVIDLAGDDATDTAIIQAGKRRYRIETNAREVSPLDYTEGWRDECLRPLYCVSCGFELGGSEISPWARPQDVLCVVHQHDERKHKIVPRCVYCGMPLKVVLVFEIPLHKARFLWICEARHSFLVSDSLEGI